MKTPQQDTGQKGENAAKQYLEEKGYKILFENWRRGQYEIDLVATFAQLLIFVEVKTRSSANILEPHLAVNKTKQQSLIKAARMYVDSFASQEEIRFDIVAILTKDGINKIDHIEDAFRSYSGR